MDMFIGWLLNAVVLLVPMTPANECGDLATDEVCAQVLANHVEEGRR